MFDGKFFVFTAVILVLFGGVTSLRDVRLLVEPTTIIRGGTAALICSRDMQNAPLYTVKWYRGNHEFYRYTPMEDPDTRVFTIPGIYVDTNRSNGSQVLLRRMDLTMAGNFSCEVTADSPSFATQIATKFIDVIALPVLDPVLHTGKDRYRPGETLHANCTSSPARPAANLTIYVNEEPVRSTEMSLHPSDSGLLWTTIDADVKLTPDLFPGGRLRLSCVATVYEVYRKFAYLDFFTPETDPRPERIVTYNTASRSVQAWMLLFFLFLLPMLVVSQTYEEVAVFNEFQYNENFDVNYEDDVQRTLVSD
ncbi:uncharacterized protein LOC113240433 [Hyposmocoma kahamanoa]|uniref:uncharacterized protein LOC113240433 n=1 Tax=Hyposmocoma kahamanoa TaxID=1477025 RepID=UPI000E6D6B17|nr:uncharacterized protein LOC113240433 [Hyposmocoma kahamanoa]